MDGATHERRRCRARSSRTGLPCKLPPIAGGTVCRAHGGAAPQVKRAAADRLADLADPAITTLHDLLGALREDVRLGAAKDILDRAGFKAKDRVEHSGRDGQPIQFTIHIERRDAE